MWQKSGGWSGQRYHLGSNKEVFHAEAYAIYRALRIRTGDRRATTGTPSVWTLQPPSTGYERAPLALVSALPLPPRRSAPAS